jgi:hypothetical protein
MRWLSPVFTGLNMVFDDRLPGDSGVTVLKTAAVGTHGKVLVIGR